jgi:hypothetical protein
VLWQDSRLGKHNIYYIVQPHTFARELAGTWITAKGVGRVPSTCTVIEKVQIDHECWPYVGHITRIVPCL